MVGVRARGEDVRRFILEQVEKHPSDISKVTARHFGITRQAVNKHLQRLTKEVSLTETGKTRSRAYKLSPLQEWWGTYPIGADLAEDLVWRNDIRPALGPLPENALNIWHYGFTEMFNNAIDHSGGSEILVHIRKTAAAAEMLLNDNGVGIFRKIQTALGLLDERHAIFELHKGKLTTDPQRHTGEGIFFTSRMFDSFDILSGGVYFFHEFGKPEDWVVESRLFLPKLHTDLEPAAAFPSSPTLLPDTRSRAPSPPSPLPKGEGSIEALMRAGVDREGSVLLPSPPGRGIEGEGRFMERDRLSQGTTVWMKIHNHTARTAKRIFDQYSVGENYGFNKTVVPVRLAKVGNDQLISRSQAKRLLARIELFRIVLFDFSGVATIGQAFADEIFRVFAQQHPLMELHAIKANSQVKRVIARARPGKPAAPHP